MSKVDLKSAVIGAVAGGIAAGVAAFLASRFAASKAQSKEAYVLVVRLVLKPGSADAFLEKFAPLAKHCATNEPGTLTYEACRGEANPDEIVIYERYDTKHALDVVHATSQVRGAPACCRGWWWWWRLPRQTAVPACCPTPTPTRCAAHRVTPPPSPPPPMRCSPTATSARGWAPAGSSSRRQSLGTLRPAWASR